MLALEGQNGLLPNLDLANTVTWYASVIARMDVVLDEAPPPPHIPAALQEFFTLGRFMARQASGLASGEHGPFSSYSIEALTLKTIRRAPKLDHYQPRITQAETLANIIEGTLRCCNNVLERFHQSFFLYLLVHPSKFISIDLYMPVLALLLVGLPCTAAALVANGDQPIPSLVKPLIQFVRNRLQRRAKTTKTLKPGEDSASHSPIVRLTHNWGAALTVLAICHAWSALAGLALLLPSDQQWTETGGAILATWALAFGGLLLTASSAINTLLGRTGAGKDSNSNSLAKEKELLACPKEEQPQENELLACPDPKEQPPHVERDEVLLNREQADEVVLQAVPAWVTAKAALLCIQSVGLAALGCLNFSLAVAGALVITPVCCAARPPWGLQRDICVTPCGLRRDSCVTPKSAAPTASGRRFKVTASGFGRVARGLLVLALSPPVLVTFASVATETDPVELIAQFVEMHKRWDALAYPFFFAFVLPCMTLSMHMIWL
jgi:hypothetical protein